MSPLNKHDLQRIFRKLDKNGDGFVSLEELNWLLERTGIQLSLVDLDSLVGKPSLDLNEFSSFYESISTQNKGENKDEHLQEVERDLVNAFRVFDLDNDGFISCEELQNVLLRLGLWDESSGCDCSSMIRLYDTNSDGKLDFQEFKSMMLLAIP